jgi:hypothetical protein
VRGRVDVEQQLRRLHVPEPTSRFRGAGVGLPVVNDPV